MASVLEAETFYYVHGVIAQRSNEVKKLHTLSKSEMRCLFRTKIAQDFGKRHLTPEEISLYTHGRDTTTLVWQRMRAAGYVKNIRSGSGVQLTSKGEEIIFGVFLT